MLSRTGSARATGGAADEGPDEGDASGGGAVRRRTLPRSVSLSSPAGAEMGWQPAPGTSWQWQLSSRPETLLDVDAYDLDGFDTSEAPVDRIHANGGRAICDISVGSWENWRPDKGRFPKRVLGRDYHGWPGRSGSTSAS